VTEGICACGRPLITRLGLCSEPGCGLGPGSCECKPVPGSVGEADPVAVALGLGDEDAAGYPAAPSAPDTEPGPNVIILADVEAEHVDWLWNGYLPRRKVVVLDGDPGVGKSTVALDLAARISTGSPMPDGTEPVKGAVLILSAEDGLADTIRPRLDAADGDADQVITITEITARNEDGEGFARPVTLPGDLPDIEKVIRRHGVVLVVVDVLMAYLSGAVDSYRDQDVRRALHPLAAMADRTGCTVLVLRHFSKTGGEKAVYRGGGSIGIIGAARAAFMCGTDPEDELGLRIDGSRAPGPRVAPRWGRGVTRGVPLAKSGPPSPRNRGRVSADSLGRAVTAIGGLGGRGRGSVEAASGRSAGRAVTGPGRRPRP
jgi:hypothetical protein